MEFLNIFYHLILPVLFVINCIDTGHCLLYCHHGNDCVTPELTSDLSQGRLPLDLIPVHYNLELQPDIYTGSPPFDFRGTVEIYIDVYTATDTIYLQQEDIIFNPDLISIAVAEDTPVQAPDIDWTGFEVNNTLNLFMLVLDDSMVVGARYKLSIGYDAPLKSPVEQYGLYWDYYVTNGNETRYLVAAQFQSSSARFMMPCYDEPHFKATFNITLVHQDSVTTLSNTLISYQEERDDVWTADIYELTPVMSCYLLCFVFSDFTYVESVTSKGVVVRIWAREDAIYAAEWANSQAAPMLEWFENYTGIDYGLQKLDHIALPGKLGAMENWGLATYGEGFLLYDPDLSTSASRQLVMEVMSHESAHMWFGNLVTCLYWNHTWLNEGFANYFQFQPYMDLLGWSGDQIQVTERMYSNEDADSVNTSVPVRIEAENKQEGVDSFSSIAYGKGGAVLRMISQFIGHDTLRRGLQRYLNRFAFGNVVTDDLWQALNEQIIEDGIVDAEGNPIDIKDKMDPWVDQRGHPVLSVDRDTPEVLGISQEMFFNPDGQEGNTPSPWDYMWNIPITFTSESSPGLDLTTKGWNDRQGTVEITEGIPDASEWILLNPGYSGFYRVLYSAADQQALVNQLMSDHEAIPAGSRGQLIGDAFNLARGNYQAETQAMEFTQYLGEEMNYVAWKALDRYMPYHILMLNKFEDISPLLQAYIQQIVVPVYTQLGWDRYPEQHLTEVLQEIVIRFACGFNTEDCVGMAQELFVLYKDNPVNNPIAPDQRMTVYCTGIRTGDQDDWDWMYNRYQEVAEDPITARASWYDRRIIIPAMACTSDQDQLTSYLDAVYDPARIRTLDAQLAMLAISGTQLGRPLVWERLEQGWRDEPVPQGVSKNAIFNEVVASFNTPEELIGLMDFIATYPPVDESEEALYNSAISTVQVNQVWVRRNRDELQQWYQNNTQITHSKHSDAFGTSSSYNIMSDYSLNSMYMRDKHF